MNVVGAPIDFHTQSVHIGQISRFMILDWNLNVVSPIQVYYRDVKNTIRDSLLNAKYVMDFIHSLKDHYEGIAIGNEARRDNAKCFIQDQKRK